MFKKIISGSCLLVLLGVLLLVCPLAAGQASASTGTEITMWTWMNPEGIMPRETALKQLLNDFKRNYPDIKVEVVSVPWQEIDAKWRAAVEVGTAPDLIWLRKLVPDRWEFYANLDETVLPKMSKEDLDDLHTLNTEESRVGKDANLAFPVWPTVGNIIYYRNDLFAKVGVEPPRTWDDFLEVAQALTIDTDGDGRIDVWGYEDSYGERFDIYATFFYALADLQPSFYDLRTKRALFATEEAVQAAQLSVDIVKKGIVPRDAITNDAETSLEQFYRARFAMCRGSAHRYGAIKKNVGWGKENMGIMAWPTWKGDRPGPGFLGGGWEIAITRGTKNLEAAGTLLRYFMSPESSRVWMEVGMQVPNRKSLLYHPFLKRPENPHLALEADIIAKHPYYPWPPGTSAAVTGAAVKEAVQKMMLEGKVDRGLLEKACELINQQLQEAK